MTLRIIAGKFKGRPLKTPKGATTRPTQAMLREAVFNICQNKIEDAHFLDIYAGSGAMAFEALSRGASQATLIEKNRAAIECIRENIQNLEVKHQVELIALDAITGLKRLKNKFDIIYIDPPYETPLAPLMEQLLKAQILKEDALLFIEERNTKAKPPGFPLLKLKDSRRFGEALLHQYCIESSHHLPEK